MMRSVPFLRSPRDGRLTDMNDSKQILTADEITAAALPQWRHAEGALHVTYATGDFATGLALGDRSGEFADRKSTRLNSSHVATSYAGFCSKKTKRTSTRPASW